LPAAQPAASPGVAARDFAQPLRLGETTLAEIQRKLTRAQSALDAVLWQNLGANWSVAIERVGEANAERFFASSPEARVVAFFRLQGEPSSLSWKTSAAIAAIDAALGSQPTPGAKRALSCVEAKLVADFLQGLAQATAKVLNLPLSDFEALHEETAIRMRAEDLGGSDPHRLEIELGPRGPTEVEALRLHVGGFRAGLAQAPPAASELPGHLDEVEVEVRARIGDSEIPLSQVLGLEEGDVIPLEAGPGAFARISVEGKDFARARLGTHQGRLALRIEGLVAEG